MYVCIGRRIQVDKVWPIIWLWPIASGGEGGEATQFLYSTTLAQRFCVYFTSAADSTAWFISYLHQLHNPCSPHWIACPIDRWSWWREVWHMLFSHFHDPIPPVRCLRGSIGIVAIFTSPLPAYGRLMRLLSPANVLLVPSRAHKGT